MKPGNDQLVVRQHDRLGCRLSATVSVAAEHQSKVVLARTAGDGNRNVRATVVDVSSGGLALESPVYFPKGCRLDVRVVLAGEGGAGAEPVQATIRVQRTGMLDRTPLYYLGGAFVSESAELGGLVERLVAAAERSAREAEKGGRVA